MREADRPNARWRKSTYSNAEGACVEVAGMQEEVSIRDSKLGQSSPIIAVDQTNWASLVSYINRQADAAVTSI